MFISPPTLINCGLAAANILYLASTGPIDCNPDDDDDSRIIPIERQLTSELFLSIAQVFRGELYYRTPGLRYLAWGSVGLTTTTLVVALAASLKVERKMKLHQSKSFSDDNNLAVSNPG